MISDRLIQKATDETYRVSQKTVVPINNILLMVSNLPIIELNEGEFKTAEFDDTGFVLTANYFDFIDSFIGFQRMGRYQFQRVSMSNQFIVLI